MSYSLNSLMGFIGDYSAGYYSHGDAGSSDSSSYEVTTDAQHPQKGTPISGNHPSSLGGSGAVAWDLRFLKRQICLHVAA